jgi:cytochrome b involved in lipid metabolism
LLLLLTVSLLADPADNFIRTEDGNILKRNAEGDYEVIEISFPLPYSFEWGIGKRAITTRIGSTDYIEYKSYNFAYENKRFFSKNCTISFHMDIIDTSEGFVLSKIHIKFTEKYSISDFVQLLNTITVQLQDLPASVIMEVPNEMMMISNDTGTNIEENISNSLLNLIHNDKTNIMASWRTTYEEIGLLFKNGDVWLSISGYDYLMDQYLSSR